MPMGSLAKTPAYMLAPAAYMLISNAYIQPWMHKISVWPIPDNTYLQITKGMKAARQADTCTLNNVILGLACDHADRLGAPLDLRLQKEQRGINDEGTAVLFLPLKYKDSYLSSPET